MTQPPAPPSAPPVIPAPAPATPPADPAGATPPVDPATPPADPATPPAAPTPTNEVKDLPDWAQKIIADTRKEAGDARAAAKKAADDAKNELTQSLGKALGFVKDEPVDPAALTASLTATQQENRLLKVQMALTTSATTHGADMDLLTGMLVHQGTLAALDPTAPDFAAQLDAAVVAAVAAKPAIRTTTPPPSSGAGLPSGPPESNDLDAQIAEATKAGNHALAIHLQRRKAYSRPVGG